MDRREFLKFLALIGTGFALNSFINPNVVFSQLADAEDQPLYCGWEHSEASRKLFIARNPKPFMNQLDAEIRGTGAGKTALLWPFLEQIIGTPLKPHKQTIGDCVAQAYGLGIDILTATQILKRNSPQRWVSKASTEIIYAGCRIEVGKNIYNKRLSGDGAEGYWAAEFLKKYGVLVRQKYGNYDFTTYNGNTARSLGFKGVPDELEPLCKLHPIGYAALVNTWEEARDCIFNGFPVILCSNQGFSTNRGRDKDGFLSPGRSPWNHAMLLAGIDESGKRPGGLIINSWGSEWVEGGTKLDQPAGSFWADASVIGRMCAQGDSIAISSYAGYPRSDYNLW